MIPSPGRSSRRNPAGSSRYRCWAGCITDTSGAPPNPTFLMMPLAAGRVSPCTDQAPPTWSSEVYRPNLPGSTAVQSLARSLNGKFDGVKSPPKRRCNSRERQIAKSAESGFAPNIARSRVVSKPEILRIPQLVPPSTFEEFEIGNAFGLEPQCRMPEDAACIWHATFGAICSRLGMILA
jgi:hypothetical protein